MLTHVLHIQGMTCNHCVQTVTRNLTSMPGVAEAQVDLAARTARVHHDESVPVKDLLAAVQKSGFQVTGFQQV